MPIRFPMHDQRGAFSPATPSTRRTFTRASDGRTLRDAKFCYLAARFSACRKRAVGLFALAAATVDPALAGRRLVHKTFGVRGNAELRARHFIVRNLRSRGNQGMAVALRSVQVSPPACS